MGEQQKGLYEKYIITKTNGKPLAPDFYAIVLRIDGGRYVEACRSAVLTFASKVRPLNKQLSDDIYLKVRDLIEAEQQRR